MSAESLYREAEGKINRFFFKDPERAMELFEAAAARFKTEKDYNRAGEAYMRAGDCAVKCKDKLSAARSYANAVSAYKKTDLKLAVQMLDVAITLQIDNNTLSGAARLEKEFAEALCEAGQTMEAIPHYEKAIQYFGAEDMNSQVKACTVAMAKIYGESDMFDKALSLYERLGNISVDGPLRHEAKEFFMRAMLCRFAAVTDDNRLEKSAEASEALDTYMVRDKYLKNTREAEFLQMCAEAVEGADMEKFETAVSLLDELRMLDEWKTHVLLAIKKNMESIR
ncbi:putative soluble N-ethylmaleimide sensitive factor (NSF) attachment protein [Trypanosoma conorhini]|uniref:Putative soluble N-ethylmaleimide sensitive factor (NSF) attachment protein n=1 Tax=Trypanosoma conorhini TaxID=83891 RepID=A0A422P501_9TRYP|nr:putative soluble N-ethylmaleimide sensitive factor (NSF) attachment protein [Trypanosoma conorhini]RNF12812.1 putative soluble N-ethylmaleimide sensitive factor (NSF) attachment protein [Trypanosoma conorhini]